MTTGGGRSSPVTTFRLSLFLAADWTRGGAIALAGGSPSSHVAMLARARGVPMVVGLGGVARPWHGRAGIDRRGIGRGRARPGRAERALPSRTNRPIRGGTCASHRLSLRARRSPPTGRESRCFSTSPRRGFAGLDPAICDGIGLVRTEFLFDGPGGLPGRGRAIRRLSPHSRMGERSAGRDPHPRRRRRQADPGLDAGWGEQSVSRPSRHPPVACAVRRCFACSCGRWRVRLCTGS